RKTTGTHVGGQSVDKIIHRTTLQIVDIISASESDAARPQWLAVGHGRPEEVVLTEPEAPTPLPARPEGRVVRTVEVLLVLAWLLGLVSTPVEEAALRARLLTRLARDLMGAPPESP
ncbi:MAG: hypothetical protein ACRD2T_12270, partial [Thermoanaerobaculia bacterium]